MKAHLERAMEAMEEQWNIKEEECTGIKGELH